MSTLSPHTSPQQSRTDRPRALSSLSYASTHSHRSSKSRDEKKLELIETTKDKRRLEGKSDPTKALHEAQPVAVALEESHLENLRNVQHKDSEGNVIVDPDRSNPTRPRMERPLDTIRGFNAAADGTTSRRSSYQRPTSNVGVDTQNRRTSHYGASNGVSSPYGRQPPPRGSGGYYNRNSGYGPRQESFNEDGPHQGPPRQHARYQSAPVAPYMPQQGSPTSVHSHHHSYETMTSGSDENSKSTNPSSQNSSYDQLHQMGQRKLDGEYGNNHNPYRQHGGPMRNPYPPTAMPNGYSSNGRQIDDYGMEFTPGAPQPPPKLSFSVKDPNPPVANGGKIQRTGSNQFTEAPKRQSWIKRTFSKKAS